MSHNTVDQSPVMFDGVRYPSQTQFYEALNSQREDLASERTFQANCSALRQERGLQKKDLLNIRDEDELQPLISSKKAKPIVLQVSSSNHFVNCETYSQSEVLKILSNFSELSLCTLDQFNPRVSKSYHKSNRDDFCLSVTEQELLKMATKPNVKPENKNYELDVDGTVYTKPADALKALKENPRYDIDCSSKDFGNRLLKAYNRLVKEGKLKSGQPMRLNTEALVSLYAYRRKESNLCICYRFIGKKLVLEEGVWKRPVYCGVTSLVKEDRWNQYEAEMSAVARGKKKGRAVILFLLNNGGFDSVDIVIEELGTGLVPRSEANAWENAEELKQQYDEAVLNLNSIPGGGSSDKKEFTEELQHKTWNIFMTHREKKGMRGQGIDVVRRMKELIRGGYTEPFRVYHNILSENVGDEFRYWTKVKDCFLKLKEMSDKAHECVEQHPKIKGKYIGIEFDPNETKGPRWYVYWQCDDCTKRTGDKDNPVIHSSRWSYLRGGDKGCEACKGIKQSERQRMPKKEVVKRFIAVGLSLPPEELAKHERNTTKMRARVNCDCSDELADWRNTSVDKLGKNVKRCRHCKQFGKVMS
ncbi:hypothetical protein [Thalassotalea aquiviva]|uniref:hypothetical protein n=1 Tax=Thalassotalea aquiviva TaxID=3242415 RepID=UPI00352AF94B